MEKPHIAYQSGYWMATWVCSGEDTQGFGQNPWLAYRSWVYNKYCKGLM
jgi:hypothetical protein